MGNFGKKAHSIAATASGFVLKVYLNNQEQIPIFNLHGTPLAVALC